MSAQSLEALAYGDSIRLARSAAKKNLRAGLLSVEDMLALECCRSMRLGQLLEAQWCWGPVRTTAFLTRVQVSPLRRVGELTSRQRDAVLGALGG